MKSNKCYRLREMIYGYGKRWDSLSPLEEYAICFAHKNINEEPARFIYGHREKKTVEYSLSHHGEQVNTQLRKYGDDESTIRYSKRLQKYQLKEDIVVYRGLYPITMDLLKAEASKLGEDQVDLYDRGFMFTSLVKGKEIDKSCKLRIYLPKGTHAYYSGNVNYEETVYYEVVVQKGAKLHILSKDKEYYNCILIETEYL